jgi:hypothetical protein
LEDSQRILGGFVRRSALPGIATRSQRTTPEELGLNNPADVGVDAAGNLYVTDSAFNRVLKLAAG